jgi:hypothetical protein
LKTFSNPRATPQRAQRTGSMTEPLSRRDLLKLGLVAGASSILPAEVPATSAAEPGQPSLQAAIPAGQILPLTSTSDVYIPPRGRSFEKFSYDFPEPSVAFENLLLSFRLYTFENTYALDRDRMTVEQIPGGIEIRCAGFVWAGGQEKAPGTLVARVRKIGDAVEWTASAHMDRPIKSIASIVRGIPRGQISASTEEFFDPKDNELLFGHPTLGAGMTTPLVVIKTGDQDFFYLSARIDQVRATRFYFQPGPQAYRTELVYEQAGWDRSPRIETCAWRVGPAKSYADAAQPHFAHLEKAFHIPDWDTREDVPAWCRDVALVVALHGMHWTGYVFNDFAKMQRTLEWVATKIPAGRVLVFLPAWDGRYYWDYPAYDVSRRLGGDEGFRALIDSAHRLGFRMMPMFGANSANRGLPVFPKFADGAADRIDGNCYDLTWTDWDNDRQGEGWGAFMNLGVDSWREWMFDRISRIIDRFGVDAYFLDIAGGWVDNTKADMYEGTVRLTRDLRKKYPHILAVGEMHYDALMSCIPVYQVTTSRAWPEAFSKYCRSFFHLSTPAPGRGSTGVHEAGFGHFHLRAARDQFTIPTITVVDDTFSKYRNVMEQIIDGARARAGLPLGLP